MHWKGMSGLDREIIDLPPLPGGATREEKAELLKALDIRKQTHLSKQARRLGASAELDRFPSSQAEGQLLTFARPADLPERPDILVRFYGYQLLPVSRRTRTFTGWFVTGYLARDAAGRLTSVHVAIEHEKGLGEVTGEQLRSLRLPAICQSALGYLRRQPQWLEFLQKSGLAMVEPADLHRAEEAADAIADKPRRQPRRGEDHYRQVALDYLEIARSGERKVLVALAERYGRPRETLRDWVHQARVLGFLEKTKSGKADPRPGPRLRA